MFRIPIRMFRIPIRMFRIPIRMAVLNLVHEFMHGFGKISDF